MDTLSLSDRSFLRNLVTSLIAAGIPVDHDRLADVKLQEMNRKINSPTYTLRSQHDIVIDIKIEQAKLLVLKVFGEP